MLDHVREYCRLSPPSSLGIVALPSRLPPALGHVEGDGPARLDARNAPLRPIAHDPEVSQRRFKDLAACTLDRPAVSDHELEPASNRTKLQAKRPHWNSASFSQAGLSPSVRMGELDDHHLPDLFPPNPSNQYGPAPVAGDRKRPGLGIGTAFRHKLTRWVSDRDLSTRAS